MCLQWYCFLRKSLVDVTSSCLCLYWGKQHISSAKTELKTLVLLTINFETGASIFHILTLWRSRDISDTSHIFEGLNIEAWFLRRCGSISTNKENNCCLFEGGYHAGAWVESKHWPSVLPSPMSNREKSTSFSTGYGCAVQEPLVLSSSDCVFSRQQNKAHIWPLRAVRPFRMKINEVLIWQWNNHRRHAQAYPVVQLRQTSSETKLKQCAETQNASRISSLLFLLQCT